MESKTVKLAWLTKKPTGAVNGPDPLVKALFTMPVYPGWKAVPGRPWLNTVQKSEMKKVLIENGAKDLADLVSLVGYCDYIEVRAILPKVIHRIDPTIPSNLIDAWISS